MELSLRVLSSPGKQRTDENSIVSHFFGKNLFLIKLMVVKTDIITVKRGLRINDGGHGPTFSKTIVDGRLDCIRRIVKGVEKTTNVSPRNLVKLFGGLISEVIRSSSSRSVRSVLYETLTKTARLEETANNSVVLRHVVTRCT